MAAAGSAVEAAGFPLRWPSPGDEGLLWNLRGSDQQVLPLLADLERMEFDAFARRNAVHGGPPERRRFEQFNGYVYEHAEDADPEAERRWRENLPAPLVAFAERPLATWRDVLLPPVRRAVEGLEQTDFDAISWAELRSRLDDALTLDRQVELTIGWLHQRPDRFLELDRKLFGEGHLPVALDLLGGAECLLLDMVRDLVQLQRLAHQLPDLHRWLPTATGDSLAALDRSVTGRLFRQALSRFLDNHGRRFAFRDLWEPSWREDPAPVLALLRGDPARPGWDPDAAHGEHSRARASAEAAVAARLESLAPDRRAEYGDELRRTREGMIVHEDYDVWMQQRCRAALREVLLACARRLTGGARIEHAQDLWWLRLEELLCAPFSITDWASIVARRKAEFARWSAVTPPRQLGAVGAPREEPSGASAPREDEARPAPEPLTGMAASRGTVRGRAVVVRSWEDGGRIEAGDVAVAPWMTPSLALWLSRAMGVVTVWGSPLDRTAMVARRLGIPAVVGCRDAERFIQTGQTIAVDGDAGTVRLVS